MDPPSALAIARATTPFLDQSQTVAQNLYDYFKAAKSPPELSRELRREAMLVSDVLQDLQKALASNTRDILSSNAGRYEAIIEGFKLTVAEMAARLEVKNKEAKKRVKWPFTAKENRDYLSQFEKCTSTFMSALQIVQGYDLFSYVNCEAKRA